MSPLDKILKNSGEKGGNLLKNLKPGDPGYSKIAQHFQTESVPKLGDPTEERFKITDQREPNEAPTQPSSREADISGKKTGSVDSLDQLEALIKSEGVELTPNKKTEEQSKIEAAILEVESFSELKNKIDELASVDTDIDTQALKKQITDVENGNHSFTSIYDDYNLQSAVIYLLIEQQYPGNEEEQERQSDRIGKAIITGGGTLESIAETMQKKQKTLVEAGDNKNLQVEDPETQEQSTSTEETAEKKVEKTTPNMDEVSLIDTLHNDIDAMAKRGIKINPDTVKHHMDMVMAGKLGVDKISDKNNLRESVLKALLQDQGTSEEKTEEILGVLKATQAKNEDGKTSRKSLSVFRGISKRLAGLQRGETPKPKKDNALNEQPSRNEKDTQAQDEEVTEAVVSGDKVQSQFGDTSVDDMQASVDQAFVSQTEQVKQVEQEKQLAEQEGDLYWKKNQEQARGAVEQNYKRQAEDMDSPMNKEINKNLDVEKALDAVENPSEKSKRQMEATKTALTAKEEYMNAFRKEYAEKNRGVSGQLRRMSAGMLDSFKLTSETQKLKDSWLKAEGTRRTMRYEDMLGHSTNPDILKEFVKDKEGNQVMVDDGNGNMVRQTKGMKMNALLEKRMDRQFEKEFGAREAIAKGVDPGKLEKGLKGWKEMPIEQKIKWMGGIAAAAAGGTAFLAGGGAIAVGTTATAAGLIRSAQFLTGLVAGGATAGVGEWLKNKRIQAVAAKLERQSPKVPAGNSQEAYMKEIIGKRKQINKTARRWTKYQLGATLLVAGSAAGAVGEGLSGFGAVPAEAADSTATTAAQTSGPLENPAAGKEFLNDLATNNPSPVSGDLDGFRSPLDGPLDDGPYTEQPVADIENVGLTPEQEAFQKVETQNENLKNIKVEVGDNEGGISLALRLRAEIAENYGLVAPEGENFSTENLPENMSDAAKQIMSYESPIETAKALGLYNPDALDSAESFMLHEGETLGFNENTDLLFDRNDGPDQTLITNESGTTNVEQVTGSMFDSDPKQAVPTYGNEAEYLVPTQEHLDKGYAFYSADDARYFYLNHPDYPYGNPYGLDFNTPGVVPEGLPTDVPPEGLTVLDKIGTQADQYIDKIVDSFQGNPAEQVATQPQPNPIDNFGTEVLQPGTEAVIDKAQEGFGQIKDGFDTFLDKYSVPERLQGVASYIQDSFNGDFEQFNLDRLPENLQDVEMKKNISILGKNMDIMHFANGENSILQIIPYEAENGNANILVQEVTSDSNGNASQNTILDLSGGFRESLYKAIEKVSSLKQAVKVS